MHRTSTWPVVVTDDGNISKPEGSDFIDSDGSYIILIPDGNIECLEAEVSGLSLDREHKFKIFGFLNKHTSISERCVSYKNYEMPFILRPETQDTKINLGIITNAKHMTLL